MTGTAANVIRIAQGEVGYHEGRDGDGDWNNVQKYSPAVPGLEWSQGQPWCAVFVSWCFHQAGMAPGAYPVTADCATATNWWRDAGRFSQYPAVGAQVLFGAGGGAHTGIVYAYDADYAYTVEGNAQPLDAAVLTPRGFVRMGDVTVGDEVIDPVGMPSMITGVYRKGVRRVFRVTMQDGSTAEACDEHLWRVEIDQRKPRTVTTLELAGLVANKNIRVRLPQVEPVEYLSDAPLPIAPYLLGALIGEGGMSGGGLHLTNVDDEIVTAVGDLLPEGHTLIPHVATDGALPGNWRITGAGVRGGNQIITALRDLGLWGKTAHGTFIPEPYRRASIKDRLALLQGLMDTDGTIDVQGRIEFTSCSQQLALDVQEVVRSLGGYGAVNVMKAVTYTSPTQPETKAASPAYRLQNVNMPYHNPFALSRKAARFKPRNGAWHRKVVAVEYVRDDEVQCIAVSAPSHLYVTDDFVPTHNTNATGSAEGDGVYLKKRSRRDPYVYGYGCPRYPGGVISADPAWSGNAVAVSLAHVVQAARTDPAAAQGHTVWPDDVLPVEEALVDAGFLEARWVDGSFGSVTVTAYAAYQRSLGYSGSDADGIPGQRSLTTLGQQHGFRVV